MVTILDRMNPEEPRVRHPENGHTARTTDGDAQAGMDPRQGANVEGRMPKRANWYAATSW